MHQYMERIPTGTDNVGDVADEHHMNLGAFIWQPRSVAWCRGTVDSSRRSRGTPAVKCSVLAVKKEGMNCAPTIMKISSIHSSLAARISKQLSLLTRPLVKRGEFVETRLAEMSTHRHAARGTEARAFIAADLTYAPVSAAFQAGKRMNAKVLGSIISNFSAPFSHHFCPPFHFLLITLLL